ncbi:MAG: hypothetical protein ACRDNB_00320 [Gaiellaceae bacterium]
MQLIRRLGLALCVLLVALAAVAATASASRQPAGGTFSEGPETIVAERQGGGNLIIELTRAVVFSGTYSGAGQAYQRIVVHQDGSANLQMTITFSGLACGQPAELEFNVVADVAFDENFAGPVTGTYTVVDSGATEARTLRGHGEFDALAGVGGAYQGEAHCG